MVFGLKFFCIIKKRGITVSKDEEVIGSYSPTVEAHVVQLQPEEVPTGFFQRGSYTGKAMLLDLDGQVHMQYKFGFKIEKEW